VEVANEARRSVDVPHPPLPVTRGAGPGDVPRLRDGEAGPGRTVCHDCGLLVRRAHVVFPCLEQAH
jgi:hypothetical protein